MSEEVAMELEIVVQNMAHLKVDASLTTEMAEVGRLSALHLR